jgi:hypothetical protein
MTQYWYTECPRCGLGGGGRLFLFEDVTNHRLYLHCDECEWGWASPEDVRRTQTGFLTLTETFESHPASREMIEEYGWSGLALHATEPSQGTNEV